MGLYKLVDAKRKANRGTYKLVELDGTELEGFNADDRIEKKFNLCCQLSLALKEWAPASESKHYLLVEYCIPTAAEQLLQITPVDNLDPPGSQPALGARCIWINQHLRGTHTAKITTTNKMKITWVHDQFPREENRAQTERLAVANHMTFTPALAERRSALRSCGFNVLLAGLTGSAEAAHTTAQEGPAHITVRMYRTLRSI